MKILIIPSWHDLDFSRKNVKFTHNFASILSELTEHEYGIIYGDFNFRDFRSKVIHKDDLPYNYIGEKSWSLPKYSFMWKNWLKKYFKLYEKYTNKYGKPDLLHAHSLVALNAAHYISEKEEIPFIYTEHLGDLIRKNNHRRDLINRSVEAAGKASICTTVSREMKNGLSKQFQKEFRYVPNMIDDELFVPEADYQSARPTFIAIGEPVHIKGLDILIEAWRIILKKLPGARLILVDEIRDRHFLDEKIDKFNLQDSIEFKGVVTRKEIVNLLNSSDILISASRYESFGMVMIEALACGLPVVSTDTAGAATIMNENTGIVVPSENTKELAEACLQLYSEKDDYSESELHDYVEENFGKMCISQIWNSIYRELG